MKLLRGCWPQVWIAMLILSFAAAHSAPTDNPPRSDATVASLESRLAEERARIAADRIRRVEAELETRRYELIAQAGAEHRKNDLVAVEQNLWSPYDAEHQYDSAIAFSRESRRVRNACREEIARCAEERARARLRLQNARLDILRLDAADCVIDSAGISGNRAALELLAAAISEDSDMLGARAATLAERERMAAAEATAWRAHATELSTVLAHARFNMLLAPTTERLGLRLGIAFALALALYLLVRLHRRRPILLAWFFPQVSESSRNTLRDLLLSVAALVIVSTALSAALGYLGLAAALFRKNTETALLLFATLWLSRYTSRSRLRWLYAFALAIGTAYSIIAIWEIPRQWITQVVFLGGRMIVTRLFRIAVIAGTLLVIRLIYRSVVSVIMSRAGGISSRETAYEREQRIRTLIHVFHRVGDFILAICGIVLFLRVIEFDATPLLAGAGIAGIALGFAAQSLIKDFLNGFFIILEGQYSVGDVVRIGAMTGHVEQIGLRTTRLREWDGTVHIIPNGEISSASNLTHNWSRAVMDVGVSYTADPEHVKRVIHATAVEMRKSSSFAADILDDPEFIGIESFGDSAVHFRVMLKTAPLKQWDIARELRLRIKKAFEKEGIEIPLPQRVVHQAKA